MMNETGNYPGQPWMWLYTFWYQVPPLLRVRQRRRPGLGPHGGAHPWPCCCCRSSPASVHCLVLLGRAPADLARLPPRQPHLTGPRPGATGKVRGRLDQRQRRPALAVVSPILVIDPLLAGRPAGFVARRACRFHGRPSSRRRRRGGRPGRRRVPHPRPGPSSRRALSAGPTRTPPFPIDHIKTTAAPPWRLHRSPSSARSIGRRGARGQFPPAALLLPTAPRRDFIRLLRAVSSARPTVRSMWLPTVKDEPTTTARVGCSTNGKRLHSGALLRLVLAVSAMLAVTGCGTRTGPTGTATAVDPTSVRSWGRHKAWSTCPNLAPGVREFLPRPVLARTGGGPPAPGRVLDGGHSDVARHSFCT